MSKKIIMATLSFVFIMGVAAQVVAVNHPDVQTNLHANIKNSLRA